MNQIFIGSSNEIGAFESGVAAQLLGTISSVVVGGSITIGVTALVAWFVPELRRLDRIESDVDARAAEVSRSPEPAPS